MHILAYLCTCAHPSRPSAHSRQVSMLSCTIQTGDRTKMMELSYGMTTKSQSGEALPCTYHMCAGARPRTYHECCYIYIYRDIDMCGSHCTRRTLRVTLPPEEGPRILQVEQSGGHPQSITTALPPSRGTELSRSAVEC